MIKKILRGLGLWYCEYLSKFAEMGDNTFKLPSEYWEVLQRDFAPHLPDD